MTVLQAVGWTAVTWAALVWIWIVAAIVSAMRSEKRDER